MVTDRSAAAAPIDYPERHRPSLKPGDAVTVYVRNADRASYRPVAATLVAYMYGEPSEPWLLVRFADGRRESYLARHVVPGRYL